MKILIVDDESLARSTLRSMLQELQLPLEVLEEATNGEEMIAQVQRYIPDIVFVDISMPKLNGIGKKLHIQQLAHYTAQPQLVEFSRLLERLSFH